MVRKSVKWQVVLVLILMAVVGHGQPPSAPIVRPLPTPLPLVCQEVIRIAPDGSGTVEQVLSVPPSPLSALYAEYARELAKPEVREDFLAQLQKQYHILLGLPVEAPRIAPVDVALLAVPAQPVELKASASIPGLARFDPEKRVWRVAVGPQDPETQDMAVHEHLSAMIFRSLYLASLPGEQQFELRREVRFELPTGAKLRDAAELEKLQWAVDFGGGTYLRGSLKVEERAVTLVEELVQTELDPKIPFEPDVLRKLANYGIFTILYDLPRVGPISIAPKPPVIPPTFSGYWSYTVSRTVSGTVGLPRTMGSVDVTADLKLYFGARLAWEFRWGRLRSFEAWINVNPTLSTTVTSTITRSGTAEGSVPVWSYTRRFHYFTVWFIPVWIDLTTRIDLSALVRAAAHATFLGAAEAGGTNRLGARWRRDVGWSPIVDYDCWARFLRFSVATGANVTTTAGPELKLTALVYGVAGPFVDLFSYLKGEVSGTATDGKWALRAGFTASGGVRMAGWIERLRLGSYSVDFYTWETPLATGSY